MLTTLFADASWCPETQAGGWGAWAKNERMPRGLLYSGPFHVLAESAAAAELMGAANALACCLRDKLVLPGETVLFQLDCEQALRCLAEGAASPHGMEALAAYFLRKKREELRLTYRTKHVKGHSSTQGTRSRVNGRVDVLAREQMEKVRHQLTSGRPRVEFLREPKIGA